MNEEERVKRRAVAIKYSAESDAAPRVVAKGDRLLAERIIAIAKENGVPIHEDPDLVSILAALDVDREIPEALYRAVAEVLAFVYMVNARARG
ncbi:MAG: EscU/YscU/HrcU family type III secretion system export apparatus switch protein [Candidatus Hydrogenedentes bacterium]|nr:EscU/YscU/HrcU family type III secretion system export apparatus switch protein [Candidatus Hydrogenedentota bacterium]